MKRMEKKEQEEQEAEKSADVLHPRIQAMLDAINENREAREALKTLEEDGCDRSVILTKLFYYCGGTEEELRVGLKEALDFRDRFGFVSNRPVDDARAKKDWSLQNPPPSAAEAFLGRGLSRLLIL